MHATKAAVEEGVVAGGGAALLYAIRALETSCAPATTTSRSASRSCAARCRRRSARSPRTPASTARWSRASMLDQKDANFGFDAQKGEYVDMIKAGIIDPTKVVRTALQGAVSVAGPAGDDRGHGRREAREEGAAGMPPGGGMGGDMDF